MADVELSYCTREDVQRELNYADSWRRNKRIDQKIKQASRDAEGLCHRIFYPLTATRTFDVPDTDTLWLFENELISVETIVSGATEMSTDDYILQPVAGPPYDRIDINWGGQVGWEAGQGTWQRAISITGDYHYPVTTEAAGALAVSAASDATSITLDNSAEIGVGSVLLIGAERMAVTEKSLMASGATLAADLTASNAQVQITVSDGDLIALGELIAIDGERMYVESISGDTLTVLRAQAGSTLAAHTTGAGVNVPRLADVARAQLGTLAGTHSSDAPIYLLKPPSLVQEYVLGLTCAALEHGSSGYARTVGSGESQRAADDRGLGNLAKDLYAAYGRKARGRAI